MDQWVKVLVTKPDDSSLIPRTCMVEGEKWLPEIVLWLSLVNLCFPPHRRVPTQNRYIHTRGDWGALVEGKSNEGSIILSYKS